MTAKRLGLPLVLLVASLSPAAAAEPAPWSLEAGSTLGWVARQSGAEVEGRFERFTAEIAFDPDDLEASRVAVEIDMVSVDSDASDRDQALVSKDLFDVEAFPSARFEAERFVHLEGESYEAHGRLAIRDVVLELTLPFTLTIEDHPEDPSAERARAVGAVEILRLDYGVGQGQWQDTSMVANEVLVTIDILARRPKG